MPIKEVMIKKSKEVRERRELMEQLENPVITGDCEDTIV